MEPSDYKHVALGLIFLKYICLARHPRARLRMCQIGRTDQGKSDRTGIPG
jgi:hypothetical protein